MNSCDLLSLDWSPAFFNEYGFANIKKNDLFTTLTKCFLCLNLADYEQKMQLKTEME